MVTTDVDVAAGATLTVAAGTPVLVAAGKSISIAGSLKVQGTAASMARFDPAVANGEWGGITIKSGGSGDLAYAAITYTNVPLTCSAGALLCTADHSNFQHYSGIGMSISAKATFSHVLVENGGGDGITCSTPAGQGVTITDSIFHLTGGDSIVVNGAGDLTFQYNHVYGNGGATTAMSGQHCACHFNSTGTFLVDHNTFELSQVGFMASEMNAQSKVNNNNFLNNPEAKWSPAGAAARSAI